MVFNNRNLSHKTLKHRALALVQWSTVQTPIFMGDICLFSSGKVIELVRCGSVINGATPSSSLLAASPVNITLQKIMAGLGDFPSILISSFHGPKSLSTRSPLPDSHFPGVSLPSQPKSGFNKLLN